MSLEMTVPVSDPDRSFLRQLLDIAIASAQPAKVIERYLPEKPKGRCIVVGAGKATAAMAAEVERLWPDVNLSGVVVTRYGHGVSTQRIKVIEASHPVADENSVAAAKAMFEVLAGLTSDDLVLSLMSGGGSALCALPALGLTLQDKRQLNSQLLMCGADIAEINAVRTAVSDVKGGRLAHAAGPARVVTLVISDIPGDDISLVGSGPTIASHQHRDYAARVLEKYGLEVPPTIASMVQDRRPLDLRTNDEAFLIASPAMMLNAVAGKAAMLGITPIVLGDALEGESRELGIMMAGIAVSAAMSGNPVARPAVILSGGETTVTIGSGKGGKGGRNLEFLLSLAIKLGGRKGIAAIAGDTDGIDGSEDAAGAIVDPSTLERARAAGLDPHSLLEGHNSYTFFHELGDLVQTGPTLTNVNDFRALLIT